MIEENLFKKAEIGLDEEIVARMVEIAKRQKDLTPAQAVNHAWVSFAREEILDMGAREADIKNKYIAAVLGRMDGEKQEKTETPIADRYKDYEDWGSIERSLPRGDRE
ncbi:MAG: hypothetical protein COU09_02370 [Candidatus Harrisonbacteria bacterium CG10_big_fil_rev_8_21_14_0_10_44_23]|uniref:Uncharacterized protein n=1 Tax=Candidatus Harrisonbacteria bacterium CG10_big_fil_rev_8_21_14_0_10_44_23 TaxID=1974585 RepID=A0A2H0URM1_9BACT|nr:MAG: hypothetical protein COU09_02370 [Candidatus Harrisonbacteria bacterium CG10_big_fil_rev_8_21_14_0_10_44_23]